MYYSFKLLVVWNRVNVMCTLLLKILKCNKMIITTLGTSIENLLYNDIFLKIKKKMQTIKRNV